MVLQPAKLPQQKLAKVSKLGKDNEKYVWHDLNDNLSGALYFKTSNPLWSIWIKRTFCTLSLFFHFTSSSSSPVILERDKTIFRECHIFFDAIKKFHFGSGPDFQFVCFRKQFFSAVSDARHKRIELERASNCRALSFSGFLISSLSLAWVYQNIQESSCKPQILHRTKIELEVNETRSKSSRP